MTISSHCSFELPVWVAPFLEEWQEPLTTISQRMQLAIALSKENVQQQTGGPFGAVIVNEATSELVSVGMNQDSALCAGVDYPSFRRILWSTEFVVPIPPPLDRTAQRTSDSIPADAENASAVRMKWRDMGRVGAGTFDRNPGRKADPT